MMPKVGQTVTLNGLTGTKVTSEGDIVEQDATLTGSFFIEEYWPAEPSMHISAPFYTLIPSADLADESLPIYEVDAENLWRHLDPEAAKRQDITYLQIEIHDLEQVLVEGGEFQGYYAPEDYQAQLDKARAELAKLQDA